MNENSNNLMIPIAIVIAGALIAGAFLFSGNNNEENNVVDNTPEVEIVVEPITAKDHILGNPNADIIIVEYSDLECPFCKDFHETLNQIMDSYGKDGRVAWVYRHFPLPQLHPKAPKEAEATECATELGGNDAFWKYTNRIFEITPSNNGLDLAQLPIVAGEIGLDVEAFQTCLDSGKYTKVIESEYNKAVAAGGRGTPYSVFLVKGQEPAPLSGAATFAQLKGLIDQTLLTIPQ